MKITIFVDDPGSWFVPYGEKLRDAFTTQGHQARLCHTLEELSAGGDIAFLISCSSIVPVDILGKHEHNLVCHPSKLPEGRGMSPLTWKILEGSNEVYITLFEAVEKVDAGVIYYQEKMVFEGHELNEELKERQGLTTLEMCQRFVNDYPNAPRIQQEGEPTYYARRSAKDSALDINKPLIDQFNLLRVVDNERYPAYFEHLGKKYILKVYKD